jgi:acyl transferase domain-containing protein/acyl carrier protein/short-subunit dehydrogenase
MSGIESTGIRPNSDGEVSEEAIRNWAREQLAQLLGTSVAAIAVDERFRQFGLDSARATALVARLSEWLGRPLSPTLVWECPTVNALARRLAGAAELGERSSLAARTGAGVAEPIAVVGLACRFPGGANSPAAYWSLLSQGVDAITAVPAERWDQEAYYDDDPATAGKSITRWGGFIDAVDHFDPLFFSISPREAAEMDPQQRHMLELAWEALEDAGIVPSSLLGSSTGVFFGAMWNDYALLDSDDPRRIGLYTATGQDLGIIAARVSYTLGLEGPSLVVNTACSSSLVAIHLACQSLRLGESSLALAGGVNLMLSPHGTVAMSKFGAMAPDGRCKAFDARANGYVRGEGGGVVVLKPLSQALIDGDPICCVIRGGAMNNDGFSNGLTAPNPQAQEKMLREAYQCAGVEPAKVHYVETHGPGTLLGDPIEAGALGAVLGAGRAPRQPLRIGSVKTNIGHLEAAAGIAGLIKVALALRHRTLPASLHFETPNPNIPFDRLGLAVQHRPEPWPEPMEVPLAGVSSFGFGGTNCHLVVEGLKPSVQVLPVAADGDAELARRLGEIGRLAAGCKSPMELAGLCRAAALHLGLGRHRCALTASSPEVLTERIAARLAALGEGPPGADRPRIVFVCGGQGGQWPGMGRALLRTEPVFRGQIEACDRALRELGGPPIIAELVAGERSSRLREVDVVQPLLVSLQIALGTLWRWWGIEPTLIVGYSVGEVAAAHLAGALSLEDAMRVVYHRTRLVRQSSEPGAMAVVELSVAEAEPFLAAHRREVFVSGLNSPVSTVLSGRPQALEEVLKRLADQGVEAGRINVDFASHTPLMEPLGAELEVALEGLEPRSGRIPMLSTVTGEPLPGEDCGAGYWARNLCRQVRFAPAFERLLATAEGELVVVELGPHPVLLKPIAEIVASRPAAAAVRAIGLPSMRRDEDEREILVETLGKIYERGAKVIWERCFEPGVTPCPLPPHLLAPAAAGGQAAAELPTGPPRAVLLPISARTPEALGDHARSFRAFLERTDGKASLIDICRTAGIGRSHHEHRLAVVGGSPAELAEGLAAFAEGKAHAAVTTGPRVPGSPPKVVFIFPGQGSQWPGMGRQLLAEEPVFRDALEICDAAIRRQVGWSVLEKLGSDDAWSEEIDAVQPVLFAHGVALTALWRSWGVSPDAVVGHSMGEVAAAHVAGALGLDDAVRVICRRSRLLRRLSGRGAMLMVELSMARAREVIAGQERQISIAVSNSPESTVLSGDPQALERLAARLAEQQVFHRQIKVDVASHSPQVDPLRGELLELLAELEPRPGALPICSTVTGEVTDGAGFDAAYWADNLRRPVRFAAAVEKLHEAGFSLFVEVSPHPILLPAVEQTLRQCGAEGLALPSLRRGIEERTALLAALGGLYVRGHRVAWRGLHPHGVHVALPTYPWQRQRYWRDTVRASPREARPPRAHPLLGTGLTSSVDPRSRFWDTTLGPSSLPDLADHRIRGTAVLPAAAIVEMALAAGAEAGGSLLLEELRCREALAFPQDAEADVQVVVSGDPGGPASFRLSSLRPGGDPSEPESWTLHATGTLRAGAEAAPAPEEPSRESLETLRKRIRQSIPPQDHYRSLGDRGLEYGPAFRGVRELWRGAGEALGRLRVAAGSLSGRACQVSPTLLDGCFQMLLAAMPATADGLYLPVGLERLRLNRRPGSETWCHVRLTSDAGKSGGAFTGDLVLLDEAGQALAEVSGLRLARPRPAASPASSAPEPAETANGWLHELCWQLAAAEASPSDRLQPGSWLLLMDRGGAAEKAARRMEALGETVIRVAPGAGLGRGLEATADGSWALDPSAPEAFAALLRQAFGERRRCRGVVHSWSLDCPPPDETAPAAPESAVGLGCGSALHLIQALTRTGWRDMPRLWLITRGAQPAGSAPARLAVAQAPLWGLGRTLLYEHPELRATRIDLSPVAMDAEAEMLVGELLSASPEEELALRPEGRYVARLVRRPASAGAGEVLRPADGRPFRLEIDPPGGLERLVLRRCERRPPAPGEVEIRVEAVGLTFLDVMKVLDLASGSDGPPPLGAECAGRITALGDGVAGLRIGQDVMALAPGSFASHVTVAASSVAPRPAAWSAARAASVPMAFATAWYALRQVARLQPGERVLIHSAAGDVGLAGISIAHRLGAEVLATAGSAVKRAYLREIGIRQVMDSRSPQLAEQVMAATSGEGADVVLSSFSGTASARDLAMLAADGRFLDLGRRDLHADRPLSLSACRQRLSYSAIDMPAFAEQRPERFQALLLEVLQELDSSRLEPLCCRVVPISRVGEAFSEVARSRPIGKLVVSMAEPRVPIAVPLAEASPIRGDATYLITGGLGGLGLTAARWLVGEGARHLLLVGRQGPGASARQVLAALEAAGAKVAVARADVADPGQLAGALARLDPSQPPLRGVIHAAGTLDDGLLQDLDLERFRKVMAPKAVGAWNLHVLTRGAPLDFFVLYSSAISLLGSPGQANYAAGNAFLDALAHLRRAQGLPALSVNWGPFSEVGLAAERVDRGERLADRGLGSLTPRQGVEVLGRLLGGQDVQVGVMPLDLRRWIEFHPTAATAPRLAAGLAEPGSGANDRGQAAGQGESDVLASRRQAAPGQRRALVEGFVREQVSQVLRLPVSRIDPTAPLARLGLESLMGLELRNRLQMALGLQLSTTLLWTYTNVASLGQFLEQQLELAGGEDTPAGGSRNGGSEDGWAPAADEPGEESASELDLLSVDELATRLMRKVT